jgi:hypothetical protein
MYLSHTALRLLINEHGQDLHLTQAHSHILQGAVQMQTATCSRGFRVLGLIFELWSASLA